MSGTEAKKDEWQDQYHHIRLVHKTGYVQRETTINEVSSLSWIGSDPVISLESIE
jgi:hypothetical protein